MTTQKQLKDFTGAGKLAAEYFSSLKQMQDDFIQSRQDLLSGFSVSDSLNSGFASDSSAALTRSASIDTDTMNAAAQKILDAKAARAAKTSRQSSGSDLSQETALAWMNDAQSALKNAQLELRTARGSAEDTASAQQTYDTAKQNYDTARSVYASFAAQGYANEETDSAQTKNFTYYQNVLTTAQQNLSQAKQRMDMAKSLLEQTPAIGLGNAEDQSVRSEFAAAQNNYKQAQDTFAQAQSALDIYSKTEKGSQEQILFNADYTQTNDTDGTATGSKFTDVISKIRIGNGFDVTGDGAFIDPYEVQQSYLDDYKTRRTADTSEAAYEEAYQILKQMENNYAFGEEQLQSAANELLSVQTNGDVQTALDSLGSASAKEYYYGVENVLGYEKNYDQAIFQAEAYAKSGVVNDEEAAKIAYNAYIDGLRMDDLNKIADTLAGSDGGGDAEKIGNNLYYYLNWKDPEITALDQIGAVGSNFSEGVSDAAQGVATFGMKIVGLEEFIPEEWQQPNWNEKITADVREEMNGVGKTILDVSYTLGNMIPSVVSNVMLPGSGLIVTFAGTAGQTYNDAIRAGFSEKEATVYGLLNAAVSTATEKAFGIFGKETKGFNLTREFKDTFSGAIGKVIKNETAGTAVTAFLSSGTGEFVEELAENLISPIIENISFDGEEYTFANNPIGLTADDLYQSMVAFFTGGILGGGSDTIVDVNTTTRLNTMMGNVRQSGESMGVSERNIRLAQDLSLLTKGNVVFTDGETTMNADSSIAINKDIATPMQDAAEVMKGMGMMSDGNVSTAISAKPQLHTLESLKKMDASEVKAAYEEIVEKYAESLKKFGFTNDQVNGYVDEAIKTKGIENQRSSIVRLQEEMGVDNERVDIQHTDNELQNADLNDKIQPSATNVRTSKIDYRKVFFEQYPETEGKVVVHHAIEQRVLNEFNDVARFTVEEINKLENLRGIPNEINSDIHLSKIRIEWNRFYREYPNPTREQFYQKAKEIDKKFGHMFNPSIKLDRGEK